MEKNVSIVLSPSPANYRKVAQRNWGLTDEQMKGKHVHHHPPVSEGGRNIPEHLYVCSPSLHSHGWHSGEYFIEQAAAGGAKGAKAGNDALPREARVRGGQTQGQKSHEEGTGLFAHGSVTFETRSKGGQKGGRCPWWTKDGEDVRAWECPGEGWASGRSLRHEIWSLPWWNNGEENKRSKECPGEGWVQGAAELWWTNGKEDKKQTECPGEGWERGRSIIQTNTQKWKCTKTGRVSTAGPLTLYQRSVGVDPVNRVKVTE